MPVKMVSGCVTTAPAGLAINVDTVQLLHSGLPRRLAGGARQLTFSKLSREDAPPKLPQRCYSRRHHGRAAAVTSRARRTTRTVASRAGPASSPRTSTARQEQCARTRLSAYARLLTAAAMAGGRAPPQLLTLGKGGRGGVGSRCVPMPKHRNEMMPALLLVPAGRPDPKPVPTIPPLSSPGAAVPCHSLRWRRRRPADDPASIL